MQTVIFLQESVHLSVLSLHVICYLLSSNEIWGLGSEELPSPGWSGTAGAGNDGGVTLAKVGSHWSVASYYHLKLRL